MKIFSFAFRNIGRNKARSIVTIGAMAFAGALMIFYSSLMEGLLDMMVRNVVSFRVGEIQIHPEGYRDDPDLYNRIKNYPELADRLSAKGLFASGRLYGFGLGALGANSAGISLMGIDVKREQRVTKMHERLLEGKWLNTDDQKGVVIGRKLAKTLGASLGDELVVLSQAADGSMANELYHVRGVLQSIGGMIDAGGVLMNDTEFRDLMVIPTGVHEIAVSRAQIKEEVESAKETVAAQAPGLETMSWKELSPHIAKILETSDAGTFIMLLITYIAIVMVTLNAMLMSVFERIREFGVMKALGVTPGQILRLVFTEAMIQGLMASVIATAVGVSLALWVETNGIDLSALTGASSVSVAGVAMDAIWYTNVTGMTVAVPILALMAVTFLAVIYPGVKAALIQPVQAIHHL